MKEGYTQTELGVIPEDWEIKRLGEIFKLTSGKTKPNNLEENQTEKKYRPVYGGNGIIGYSEKYNSSEEIILIGRVGEYCGVTRYINEICWITDNALYTKVFFSEVNKKFLAMKLQYLDLSRLRNKGGQPLISQNPIHSLAVSIPPIEEQNAIADCLSTWDEAIEKQQELIEAKEIRHKALMQKLLSGKKRLPGFTDEWKFVRFKEFYSENKKQLGNDKLEVLSVTKNGIVSQSEYFNKEIASSDTSKYLIVEKNDLVVSGLNFWMGSFDVLSNFDIGVVSPAYKVFSLNKGFNNLYFKFLSKSKLMLDAMVGASIIGASIVRRNFDKEILYEWTFKIPSLEEQKKIGEFLENSSREIEIEKQKVEQLKEQKKALMQKLLTGKVRLPLNN